MKQNSQQVAGIQKPFSIKEGDLYKFCDVMEPFNREGSISIYDSQANFTDVDNNLFFQYNFEKLFGGKMDFLYADCKNMHIRMKEMAKVGDLKCMLVGNRVEVKGGNLTMNLDLPSGSEREALPFNLSNFKQFGVDFPVNEDTRRITHTQRSKKDLCAQLCFDGDDLVFINRIPKDRFMVSVNYQLMHDRGKKQKGDFVLESTDFLSIKADKHTLKLYHDGTRYLLCTVYEIGGEVFYSWEWLRIQGDSDPANKVIRIPEAGPEDKATVEGRIEKNYLTEGTAKHEIYQDLVVIEKHNEHYFMGQRQYIGNLAHYIRDRYQQERSTYYTDARVVEMYVRTGREHVLESNVPGVVSKSKAIAYAPEEIQIELLDKFDAMDLKAINDRIKQFNNGKKPATVNDIKPKLSWLKLAKSKKKDSFTADFNEKAYTDKGERLRKQAQFQRIVKMLIGIDDEMLPQVLRTYDQLESERKKASPTE
ncbi:hypothetical protein KJ966_22965 [bacterium]|nr:hypothetical protein [bacterium]